MGSELLVVTNYFPDRDNRFSDGTFVKELLREQERFFDSITVLAPQPWKPWNMNRERRNYTFGKVKVHFLRYLFFNTPRFMRRHGEILFQRARRLVRGGDFEAVHAHFSWPAGYAAFRMGEELGVPSVITVHESIDWLEVEYKEGGGVHDAWRGADALTRVNRRDIPLLEEFNRRVFHVPNGYDERRFRPLDRTEARRKLSLPEEGEILFSLGGLVERKGFHHLVEAMAHVVKEKGDVRLYIGGRGEMRERLLSRIKELRLEEHVHLLGYVEDKELPLWMNSSDLFVFPSLYESFGIAVLQALACGTPAVATINGGSEEVITSPEQGILLPPGKPKELARGIIEALEREWNRARIRKSVEDLTWKKVAERYVEVYQKITR